MGALMTGNRFLGRRGTRSTTWYPDHLDGLNITPRILVGVLADLFDVSLES